MSLSGGLGEIDGGLYGGHGISYASPITIAKPIAPIAIAKQITPITYAKTIAPIAYAQPIAPIAYAKPVAVAKQQVVDYYVSICY